jgi:hypothetical protein
MSAVVEAVTGAISDVVEFVGDVGETVVQAAGDVVETVGDVAEGVVQGAVQDPLGTIAKVGTAIYAPYLLPVVNAGVVVANGGDLEDALISGATSWATQGITQGLSDYLPTTEFGQALGDFAQSTGIEALPQAAVRGISSAAAGTAAGLAQGQDIGDALTRGLSSGVGSTVGRIAGSEIDTGSQIADRLIGQTIGGGTTAALRGKDFETGAESALASGLFDVGMTEGIKGLQALGRQISSEDIAEALPTSTEAVSGQPLLADTGATATDTSLTPTEEAIRQMTGKVTVYDPVTGEPIQVQPEETEADKANLEALIEALYPSERAEDVTKIDEFGNAYDNSGQIIGDAYEFGLTRGTDAMGNPAWITSAGETIAASQAPEMLLEAEDFESSMAQPSTAPTPYGEYGGDYSEADINPLIGTGEMEGDYPEKIINNPDGSTTVIEFDGTQRIFNIDGSVTTIDPYGAEEFAEEEAPVEEAPAEEETESSLNLNNLANALLGTSSGGTSGGTRTRTVRRGGSYTGGIPLGAIAGIGAGIAAGMESEGQTQGTGMGAISPYGFDWRTGQYMNPVNAVAYGQEFVRPEYTMTAASGGLMSIPQYITPTVPNNGITFKQPQDPSASVMMYNRGGLSSLGSYSDGGRMLKGPGDGMSDDIPATIAGRQPARLANEEFVIPADVVSHLGNGSSEAGAKVLYDMMARVRKARTGTTRQGKQINPRKHLPK